MPGLLRVREVPQLRWSSPQPFNLRPRMTTMVVLVAGLVLFGFGEALLIASGAGVSPWTVFAEGLALQFEWTIGFSTFVVSLMVLLLWIPLRQKPGIGTLLNAVIIALVIDLSLPWLPTPPGWLLAGGQVVAGVLIVGVGSGLYLTANLGPGPRDGLMTGLQRVSAAPLAPIRVAIEVSVVVAGWWLGGTVGAGTLIFAFGVGPAVALGILAVRRVG